jgi:dCTP deaminase
MTHGASLCGYDVTVREGFSLWPMGFRLASVREVLSLPDDVCAVVHGKSSLARLGVTVQNTFIEPGWQGYLTVEITNHTWRPRKIVRGQPIAQIVFHRIDKMTPGYSGRYQNQPPRPVPTLRLT